MHGLIFFYIQKYAESVAGPEGRAAMRTTVATASKKYLPSDVYPDNEAVTILNAIAESSGVPIASVLERFGEFLAPHLVRVAGSLVEPFWKTLDLIEHTEGVIHAMVRTSKPGAAPPVIECVRIAPEELSVVYTSRRQLCHLAVGLIRGLASHFQEEVDVDEPSCMLRGDAFCSFTVRTRPFPVPASLTETVMIPTPSPLTGGIHATVSGDSGPPREAAAEDGDRHEADSQPLRIGGYTIVGPLGEGGMGRVYLARDERLGREVAIKIMLPRRAVDEAAKRRFLRESRATAAVEHENIVTIHHVGEQDGVPFIVMQRLEGSTLASYRDRAGPLPIPEVLRIGREAAAGLAAAHRRGLVHRDIKPDNIWLDGPGRRVKIIDFGLAHEADAPVSNLTMQGAILGTPAYMSPERVSETVIDGRSDVFGLGVILYELLAGRLPFDGKSMISMLAAVARGCPEPLDSIAPGVPKEVSALVMRLIAHAPADRPEAAQVVAAIAEIERRLLSP